MTFFTTTRVPPDEAMPRKPAGHGPPAAPHGLTDGARRLEALSALGADLLDAHTETEAYEAGSKAIAEGTDADSVSVYRWNDTAGTLERTTTACDETTRLPRSLSPGDSTLWQAFATRESRWTDDDSGGISALAVSVGVTALAVVSRAEHPAHPAFVEFVESVAHSVAVAVRRVTHRTHVDALSEEAGRLADELSAEREYLASYHRASGRIADAESKAELTAILLGFTEPHWPYAWIGSYRPQNQTVVPTATTADAGPAGDIATDGETRTKTHPAIRALTDGEPVYIEHTVETRRWNEWSRRLLSYGYRSAVTVPIASDGVSHGVLEVMAAEAAAFDDALAHLSVLSRTAAARLNQLHRTAPATSDGSPITADIALSKTSPLFPSLPPGVSVRVRAVIAVEKTEKLFELTVSEMSAADFEAYASRTSGLFDPRLTPADPPDDSHGTVRLDLTATDRVRRLFRLLSAHDARLRSARSDSRTSLLSIEMAGTARLRELIDAIDAAVTPCRLVAKRTERPPTAIETRLGVLDTLTDRQREILTAAHRNGHYDRPKTITCAELAEQFGLSRSTVHEHLRNAERQLMDAVFE